MMNYKYFTREEDRKYLTRNGFKKSKTYLSEVPYVHFFEREIETEGYGRIRIIIEFDEHRSEEIEVMIQHVADEDSFEMMRKTYDFQCMTLEDIFEDVLENVYYKVRSICNALWDFWGKV